MEKLREVLSSPCTGPRVLLGCTGSVATIKVPLIAERLQQLGITVIIVPTRAALHFLSTSNESIPPLGHKQSVVDRLPVNSDTSEIKQNSDCQTECNIKDTLCSNCKEKVQCNSQLSVIENKYPNLLIVDDSLEWSSWQNRGDPVLHIELRKWADILLIAPLSANSLAKLSNGLCDNLLTCIVRAWDSSKPLLFCPAMNTHMYEHIFTANHINALKDLGYTEIEAVSKKLMCGDVGKGAMAEISTITDAVQKFLKFAS